MNIVFRDKQGNERPASMREVMLATSLDQTIITTILNGAGLGYIDTPLGQYHKRREDSPQQVPSDR